jgi:catechol 2,3-dioxygenase-like lactoylglutathione lyase family enzyme
MSFGDLTSSAIVAVSNLGRSRSFYADTLGLELVGDSEGVLTFSTGASKLVVYASDTAGTNQANAVVWSAKGDFDAVIDELRGKGVAFEEYPELGMDIAAGVHSTGAFKAAWFKDPDGNILHVNNM